MCFLNRLTISWSCQLNHQWQYWRTLVFPSDRLTDGGHDGVQSTGVLTVRSVMDFPDGTLPILGADTLNLYSTLRTPPTQYISISSDSIPFAFRFVKLCILHEFGLRKQKTAKTKCVQYCGTPCKNCKLSGLTMWHSPIGSGEIVWGLSPSPTVYRVIYCWLSDLTSHLDTGLTL